MGGPEGLCSYSAESQKQRPKSIPKALYYLKSTELRDMLMRVVALTICCIATWETQHKRYSDERSTLLETMLYVHTHNGRG